VVALAEELQATSGKRVLWGTAQLFMHPRYADGAATSAAPRPRAWGPSQCGALWVQMQASRRGAQAVAHV
jgi:xylose isomerase